MKRRLSILLVLAGLALLVAGCGGKAKAPAMGAAEAAAATGGPDFALKDLDGKLVRLSDLRGQVVIVDFWATWCGPCKLALPHLQRIHDEYGARGVKIVAIAMDDQGASVVRPFVAQQKLTFTVVLPDDQVDRAFGGIRGLPTTFVIGPDGRIFKKHIGFDPNSTPQTLLQEIRTLKPELAS